MKLEKITLGGIEFYQWVKIATEEPFINEVGDLFTDPMDILKQKDKLLEMNKTK